MAVMWANFINETKAVAKVAALLVGMIMEERTMCKEQNGVYVVEVDMNNKSAEDIAREAALQIIGITDVLIEQQKQTKGIKKWRQ